jgi:ribosomal protein S27AE
MLWIDVKYAGLLSVQLDLYSVKQNQPFLANFRCPLCGDSKKNKNRKRGYLYQKPGGLFYKCHNCGAGTTMNNFLKQVDPAVHKQYRMELFKEKGHRGVANNEIVFEAPKFKQKTILDEILLPATEIKDYLIQRGIPEEFWSELYYCDDSHKLEQLDERYEGRIDYHNPRLVIPAYTRTKDLIGITARAIDSSTLRYCTVRLDDTTPLIFGLDRVDITKTVYVTEGPIDSFFVKNCLGVGSSDLLKVEEIIPKNKLVLIFDNEPRNLEIVKQYEKAIEAGYNIFIWPSFIEEKDLNDFYLNSDSTLDSIMQMINTNTHSGLRARVNFNNWRKVR